MSYKEQIDKLYDTVSATGTLPLDKMRLLLSLAYSANSLIENNHSPYPGTPDRERWLDLNNVLRRLVE